MNSVNVSPSSGFSHVYDSMNSSLSSKANPLVLVALTVIIIFYFISFFINHFRNDKTCRFSTINNY